MIISTPISERVSGTGILDVPKGLIGSIAVTWDGTNSAVIILRDKDENGKLLLDCSIRASVFNISITVPSGKMHYNVSGTGASAMFYEGSR